ncbi:hypothetical protein [Metabacillus fastidiosus]|uniref:hypothetical protein n=1 Tax=Metabacillus fastidiosus TaxID=1458 RepID=UPI003D2C6C7E
MGDLKFQAETLQLSIYSEIILNLLDKHKEISLPKSLVFAYLVRKDKFESQRVYNGRHTSDTVYKSLSLLSGDYEEFCKSVEFILKSIHLLKENNLIILEENILKAGIDAKNSKSIYGESVFLTRAIEASKNMSDKQFLKEVLSSV